MRFGWQVYRRGLLDETYIVLCCSVENKSSSGRVIQLPVTDGNGWTLRELLVVLVDGVQDGQEKTNDGNL